MIGAPREREGENAGAPLSGAATGLWAAPRRREGEKGEEETGAKYLPASHLLQEHDTRSGPAAQESAQERPCRPTGSGPAAQAL